MIIRKTPKGDYIKVDGETSLILNQNGFLPKYIDNNYVYYIRNMDILKFMEINNLTEKK